VQQIGSLRPTRFGGLWLAGAAILLLLGIQLQSNGPLLVGHLMLGLFLLALPLTRAHLQVLELRCGRPRPGFAGSELPYPLVVRCAGRCEGVRVALEGKVAVPLGTLPPGEHRIALRWRPRRRGLQRPGRVHLSTTAPLGMVRCRRRWDPEVPQLVYPERRVGPVRLLTPGALPSGATPAAAAGPPGREETQGDWRDLRPHRQGEAPGRLAWKLFAQGRGRHAKQFGDASGRAVLLAPDPDLPEEEALQHLSERIWRLHGQGARYGLRLRERWIPAGEGAAQRDRCLEALARCR
jgi:uncharacterized protein (DUF58 family)